MSRKKPPREEKPLKEKLKIASKVFDNFTLRSLVQLINKKNILSLDYPISEGKEAVVFRATTTGGFVALKIFKYETTSFKKRTFYLEGDERFRVKKGIRALVNVWARKEFANLKLAFKAGVLSPKPLFLKNNIVIMQFIGVDGRPAPQLHNYKFASPEEKENCFSDIMKNIELMLKAGLVHADLSPYNILIHKRPYIIDLGQGVIFSHPSSRNFLKRDIFNVLKFFGKLEKYEHYIKKFEKILSNLQNKKTKRKDY